MQTIDAIDIPVNQSVQDDNQLLWLFPGAESVRDNNLEVASWKLPLYGTYQLTSKIGGVDSTVRE